MIFDRVARERGAVLVVVLWFLATLTVIAAFFASWVERTVVTAISVQSGAEGYADVVSTRSTLLYLLNVEGVSPAGILSGKRAEEQRSSLSFEDFMSGVDVGPATRRVNGGEIAVDARAYAGIGSSAFAVVDSGGLLDVSGNYERTLERYLESIGVDDRERLSLLAKLADYTDKDDFHRADGAESSHYREGGVRPPANAALTTPMELARVLGWAPVVQRIRDDGVWDFLTVHGHGVVNINAAPEVLVALIPGVTREDAKKIVNERNKSPFTTVSEILPRTGVSVLSSPDALVSTSPGERYRISLWTRNSRMRIDEMIELTPFGSDGRPWEIVWSLSLPLREGYFDASLQKVDGALFSRALPSDKK